MRVALVTLAAAAGLAAPAQASAHARGPTVAIDYRLRLTSVPAGVHARILDGDRSLEATVDPGSTLLVTGLLHEPMLRIDGGVWANRASPTAHTDRVLTKPASRPGWVQLSGARTFAWHDHRLTPAGPRGRFAIGVRVNGRPGEIAGSFVRVPRPALWPWLVGVAAFGAAVWAVAARSAHRLPLTVGLGLAAGAAALATSIAFAVRDRPGGGVGWLQIGTAVAVALALGVPLLRFRGRRRAQAAGVMGAVAAAVTIALLPVFWHGVVISALPGDLVRFACAVALAGGAAAAALSLLPEFDA
jgi:hypothetical protein